MSTLSSLVGQHYAYASGRIGVVQQMLLRQSDVDRLLGAHGAPETEKIFTELPITNGIDQGLKKGDAILKALEQWVVEEIGLMAPVAKQPVFHILWLQGDAPLLAYLLKKKLGLTSAISEEPHSGLSAYDATALRELVLEGKESSLPSHVVEFVQEALATEEPTAAKIDTVVMKFVTSLQLKLARASGSKSITKLVQHQIDLRNIRTALRLLKAEKQETDALLPGGQVALSAFSSLDSLKRAVAATDLQYYVADALGDEDLSALERAGAAVVAADIAKMWNVPLSVEPVFAFASIALAHIQLMRTILIAKRNGLTPQEAKSITPPFLSAAHYLS